MTNNFLQDKDGNKSSKRLIGTILIFIGCLGKITIFNFELLIKSLENFDKLDSSAMGLLYVGACLIGGGILEGKFLNIAKK